ncbi:hypothetical protein ACFQH8_01010 [Halomicroarcula sp. GCM10025710]
MSPRVSAALLAFLLLVPVAMPGVGATAVVGDGPVAQTTPSDPVTENTTFYIQLRANGDAKWTITDTYALEDENDTRAFEDLATKYVDGETDPGWLASFRQASAAASEATGREMNVTDVRRDYVVSGDTGTLVLEFTWTNFATVGGDRLVVGDAFNTTDGTWLGSLTAEQRLVISPPAGYGVRSVPTAVEGGEPGSTDRGRSNRATSESCTRARRRRPPRPTPPATTTCSAAGRRSGSAAPRYSSSASSWPWATWPDTARPDCLRRPAMTTTTGTRRAVTAQWSAPRR